MDLDLDHDLDHDLDLDLDLDHFLIHPQTQHTLRVVHAFMHDRVIEHVVEERVPAEDGVFRQEQLIWCIKRQQQQQPQGNRNLQQQLQQGFGRVRFKLRAMFLYNFDLEAEEVPEFLRNPDPASDTHARGCLVPISAVEDVPIRPTIPAFADLNALYIMYEAASETKRVVVTRRRSSDRKARGSGTAAGTSTAWFP
jgi:hypothetical protein